MHIRHAQRKHIIYSLDTLLYQLHALSFFLSSSVWAYLFRVIAQSQFQRPREVDSKRSLRFWFVLIVLFNGPSVWTHATTNPADGRSIMLDFVGMVDIPSTFHLLALDFLIITLTLLLTTISYEHSLLAEMPSDTIDPLQPIPHTSSFNISLHDASKVAEGLDSSYVMEVRLAPIIARLRNPPPVVQARPRDADQELLPLPNVVPWQRLLLRARATARGRTRRNTTERNPPPAGGDERSLPGALNVEEGI